MTPRQCFKLVMLGLPWLAIWCLGTLCALAADAFIAAQDWFREIAEELNEEIQKL